MKPLATRRLFDGLLRYPSSVNTDMIRVSIGDKGCDSNAVVRVRVQSWFSLSYTLSSLTRDVKAYHIILLPLLCFSKLVPAIISVNRHGS